MTSACCTDNDRPLFVGTCCAGHWHAQIVDGHSSCPAGGHWLKPKRSLNKESRVDCGYPEDSFPGLQLAGIGADSLGVIAHAAFLLLDLVVVILRMYCQEEAEEGECNALQSPKGQLPWPATSKYWSKSRGCFCIAHLLLFNGNHPSQQILTQLPCFALSSLPVSAAPPQASYSVCKWWLAVLVHAT